MSPAKVEMDGSGRSNFSKITAVGLKLPNCFPFEWVNERAGVRQNGRESMMRARRHTSKMEEF